MDLWCTTIERFLILIWSSSMLLRATRLGVNPGNGNLSGVIKEFLCNQTCVKQVKMHDEGKLLPNAQDIH